MYMYIIWAIASHLVPPGVSTMEQLSTLSSTWGWTTKTKVQQVTVTQNWRMCCWNCVSASKRITYRMALLTWIPSGLSDTNVTAPPGLSVCCHLWGASWAFASESISQTAREQLHTANFISLPRRFCMQASPSLLASFFLLSLLTSLHPPHHLSRIRWDLVWSFSLLSPRQGIASTRGLGMWDDGQCHRLVGSSSLLDLLFPPPVTLLLRWSGVHLLSVLASAFPTHTRTSHYATSSERVQTKLNTSSVRQMNFLS